MDMYLIQQAINALSYGSILALLAIGYTMIYGILGLINFAHGEIFMIGAFCAYLLVAFAESSFLVGVLGAIGGAVLIGLFLERMVYRPCLKRNKEVLTVFIASFGASLGFRNLMTMIFGDGRRAFPIPEVLDQIIATVRSKDTSLERSLDLFDEAIELGSRAVDMVDKFELTPREADKLEQEYDEDAANESQDS